MPNNHESIAFELRHLAHLVALHEHGTLQAAADAIHLSQSALTKSIAALEEALGSPLFDRSRRRLVPNALHEKVLARAQTLLRGAVDLQREAQLYRRGQIDELHLGVGPVVALGPLPEALLRFRATCPEVRVVVRVDSTAVLAPALVAGDLDLVVADREQTALPDDELHIELLEPDPIGGAVRPGHPLLDGTPTLAEASSYPRGAATAPERFLRFAAQLPMPIATSVDVTCDNYEVLASLAEQSDLVVVGPRSVLARYADAGRLAMLPITYPSPPSEPGVMLAAGRPVPPAVRALADAFLVVQDA
ncbi:MAG: LysR family transcriptional regulator [Deltaproteobacteria bacterium]|nr:MAG: LysR family transcriptional regulator [Deltaproteobacteria bacterium]